MRPNASGSLVLSISVALIKQGRAMFGQEEAEGPDRAPAAPPMQPLPI